MGRQKFDRRDRYQTAKELAGDLGNYLDGRPVSARPIGVLSKSQKWIRRNPLVATLAFSVVATLLLGTAIASYLAVVANDARELAQIEKSVATERFVQMQRNAYALQLSTAYDLSFSQPTKAKQLLGDASICTSELKDFTWGLINGQIRLSRQSIRNETPIELLAASPFANHLAIIDEDGSVNVWHTGDDNGDGRYLRSQFSIPASGTKATAFAFSTHESYFAAGLDDGRVIVQDGRTADLVAIIDRNAEVPVSLAFQDNNDVLVIDHAGNVEIWSAAENFSTLVESFTPEANAELCASAVTPHGSMAAALFADTNLVVWDFESNNTTKVNIEGRPTAIAFRSRNEILVASGEMIFRVDLVTKAIGPLHTELAPIKHASPFGIVRFAAATDDDIILLGDKTRRLEGHDDIRQVALSSDKRRLYLLTGSHEVVLCRLSEKSGRTYTDAETLCFSIAEAPQRNELLLGGGTGELFVIDRTTGKLTRRKKLLECPTYRVAVSKMGKIAAFGGKVKVWNDDLSKRLARRDLQGEFVTSLLFDDGEHNLLFVTESGKAGIWPYASKQPIEWIDLNDSRAISMSHDGKLLATSSDLGGIEIRQVADPGNVVTSFASFPSVGPVVFSPDGMKLAICTNEKRICILNTADTTDVACDGHERKVQALSFSPDGKTLASAGFDGSIRLWDAETGLQRLAIRNGVEPYISVQFSSDGKSLFAISTNGTWTIWDADFGNSTAAHQ